MVGWELLTKLLNLHYKYHLHNGYITKHQFRFISLRSSGYEYSVQFESEAFAAGKHRRCYIATLSNEKAPKHNRKVVLKVFKPEYVSKFGFDYECVKDLERSITCHELCIKFNKAMNEYSSHTLPISLPAPLRINIKRYKDELIITTKLISKVFNNIPIKIKNHKYLTVQLFLQNNQSFKYNKLSSNNGWIGDKYEFLSAFSHFSWVHTKGNVLYFYILRPFL